MVHELSNSTEQKMSKSLDVLRSDLAKIRTGRAHTGILDHILVNYYDTMTPINQVANVTLIDARNIGVQPWEKTMVEKVEKAIRESDLGLNPATQGDLIRIPMPPLTEERRRELGKVVRHEGENARVAIRNLRRDANNSLKEAIKNKTIGEDEERRSQEGIQKITDRFIGEIDNLVATKEKELMAI